PLDIKGLGAGLSFTKDKTGDSRFTTTKVKLSGSYRYQLDSLQTVSAGMQFSYVNRGLSTEDLHFDNQYNGFFFDPTLPKKESLNRTSRSYINSNLGVNYTYTPKDRVKISGGVSMYNLNTPKQTFFSNDNIALDRRVNIHINGQYPMTRKIDILPSFLLSTQGSYKELLFGGSGKYTLVDNITAYRAVYLGLWTRTGDATFLNIGFDYNEWYFGASY
ncbi:MAG: PorP/SprF family type IX secretion system membrane protein, partial [Flavobacteriales bacterium]